ncbi:MAG: SO_0444 family Cu/Zn efflux transporter [Phycisphaerae bacterium]
MREFVVSILTDPATLRSAATSFWATAAEMSPYLLFGFFVAGILSMFVSQRLVERHLGGRGIWPVLKASLLGVPLPLCSCGVIPVSMSLHKHGAGKGSTIAFLISTPQTGVDSIFVTLSLLGPVFAIFRPVMAFVTGIIGGVFVDLFNPVPKEGQPAPAKCTDECCGGAEHKKIRNGLKFAFVTLPRDIGGAMLVGLVIAAFISVLAPDDFFAEKLGTGIFAMLVMMALGIPMYVCATASVPIAAALILKGLTPGAALVFLMTGPATNAATFATIWKVLGRATAITYLVTIAGCSLLGGILLDYIFSGVIPEAVIHRHGWELSGFVKNISAVVLLAILGFGLLTKKKHTKQVLSEG